MKVSIFFAWYDFWIGAYYDRAKRILYVCPFPMIVIKVTPAQRAGGDESEDSDGETAEHLII